jgi:hypothetical protein
LHLISTDEPINPARIFASFCNFFSQREKVEIRESKAEGFRYYFVPVEPNPPAPRSVPESSSLSVKLAVK